MQHLEVSGAVRPIYVSLGVKGSIHIIEFTARFDTWKEFWYHILELGLNEEKF
jgi:hypothetical protein